MTDSKRVFKWYYIKDGIFPQDKELVHFDDRNNIMHLGYYYKIDQFERENVFVSTEGAFFTSDKVEAWIPAPHSDLKRVHNRVSELEAECELLESKISTRDRVIAENYKTIRELQSENKRLKEFEKMYDEETKNMGRKA